MKRGLVLACVALAAAAAAAALVWPRRTDRVRVGGMGNACTCTLRIEP